MDAADLSRWTRFAAKGGIGKCTATQDCVAEGEEDLMFLKDDVITVLMQIPNTEGVYLGYCEGVVGRFQAQHVQFHSKLKRPVIAKRNSSASSRPTSSSGQASLQQKSPTPSMFSAYTAVSPAPGTPNTPNMSSHSPSPNTPNTPVTPNTPMFTNGAAGTNYSTSSHSETNDSRRASVVYTGPAAAAGSGLSASQPSNSKDKFTVPVLSTPDGLLSPESLKASTSTSSTLSTVSVSEIPQDPSPPPSQHIPSNSISSVASSVSKYSSSQYSSHSPSPSVTSVSTAHTAHTTHTIASVLSGHSTQTTSTLDVDYGLPRVLSPHSIHSVSSGHSVSSSGSKTEIVASPPRPTRKDSLGALKRHPSTASTSTMTSTSTRSRGRQASIESYATAEASYLDEDDVDEGDFEMVRPGPGSGSGAGVGIHYTMQTQVHYEHDNAHPPSTSALGFGPASLSKSMSDSDDYGTPMTMSRSVSGSTASSTSDSITRSFSGSGSIMSVTSSTTAQSQPLKPQLSRSTSQKSVMSVASATSDGEVGIGLSLLASLGEGSSDEDEDDEVGDRTMRMLSFDTDDEEDSSTGTGLSYTIPTPSTSSTSVPVSSTQALTSRSLSPVPSLSNSSASHSTYSDGHSPIPGDAVAAFPQPPPANEMEVRRLSRIILQQQTHEQEAYEAAQAVRAQQAQRNFGSAMGGRTLANSSSVGSLRSSQSSMSTGTGRGHAYNASNASFRSSSSSSSSGGTAMHPHMLAGQGNGYGYSQQGGGSAPSSNPTTPNAPSFSPFAMSFPPSSTTFPSTESPKDSPTSAVFLPAQNPPQSPAFSTHSNSSSYSNGEDWEGASDIYDNYLYRYSVASKISGWSGSAGSRLSAATVNSMRSRKQSATSSTMPLGPGMSRRPSEGEGALPPFAAASSSAPQAISTPPPVTPPLRSASLPTSSSSPSSNLRVTPVSPSSQPSPVSPMSTASSSVNSHDHGSDSAQAQNDVQPIEESQRPLRSRQNSSSSVNLLSNDESVRHSAARRLIAINGDGGEESDDGSVYSDFEGKQRRPGRLTMMEAHAVALIGNMNTTGPLNIVKSSNGSESGVPGTAGLTSPLLRNAQTPLTAAEAQARLAASNTIISSNSASDAALHSPPVTSTPMKNRPSPLDFANPTREAGRDDMVSQISGHSLGPSPLLHTRWGSPLSSAELSAGTDSVYSDGGDNDLTLAGGIASALRQRSSKEENTEGEDEDGDGPRGERSMSLDLDGERFKDRSMSTLLDNSLASIAESHPGDKSEDTVSEHGLVVEDDEELPSHARNEELDTSLDSVETSNSTVEGPATSTERGHRDDSSTSKKSLGRIVTNSLTTSQTQVPQIGVTATGLSSPSSPYSASDLPLDLLPPPSPSSFPPPSSIVSQGQASHLRPTLNELRGYTPGQGRRQSLFLPHPNAPKPPTSGEGMGPMVIRDPIPAPNPVQRTGPDPRKLAINVLRMVLASPAPPPQNMLPPPSSAPIRGANSRAPPPPPTHQGPTIYARVDIDLASSTGPVPITFGIQPLGPPPLPPQPSQFFQPSPMHPNLGANTPPTPSSPAPLGIPGTHPVSRTPPAPPSPKMQPPPGRASPFQGSFPLSGRDSPVETELDLRDSNKVPRRSATALISSPKTETPSSPPSKGSNGDVPKPRPRSRSFSAFTVRVSASSTASSPIPAVPTRDNASSLRTRGSSASLTSSPLASNPSPPSVSSPSRPSSLTKQPSNTKLRVVAGPSPLSLPQNNIVLPSGMGGIKPPLSPLATSSFGSSSPQVSTFPSSLRKVTSASSLRDSARASISKTIGDVGGNSPPTSPKATRLSKKQSLLSTTSNGIGLVEPQSPKSPTLPSRHFPSDSDAASMRSTAVSPPPSLAALPPLHTKLSLPNLNRLQPRRQGSLSSMSGLPSPRSPTEPETLQVKDMDFELVRPTLGFAQTSGRSSEDSSIGGGRPDPSLYLRADSPAVSISSVMSGGSRGDTGSRAKPMTRSSDNEASIESHRQREQKWMTLMQSVPASQSRKSKKVRKLIGDGVPSSVRYLVWSHLTDCKAKNVPGVYTNFVKRARVPSFQNIDRDVKQCFGEHPHLQSTEGPLLSLLQAYLTMVPDVQYSTGLTLIAGQLLLLAPEEDAFWIFVTIMDSVLRPYFSPNSTQMEVDAALFSRALEVNDSQVSKKVLVDMSMNPVHLCSPWFSTLFVGVIPGDYVNRVWDLFLFEGVPFLIRAGLAIIYCCRRAILEATNESMVLQYLKRPPPTWLPPSAEAFVTLALSFKVKDDDVRKQRVKMEAQVKRQTQAPPRPTGGAISLPRS